MQKTSPSAQPAAAAEETAAEFIPVPLEGLRLDTVTGFNIYLSTEGEREPVLYRTEDLAFTEQVRKRLVESKVEDVYIDAKDRDKYQKYIEDNLGKIVADNDIEPIKKAEIVYSSASYLMERLFENPTLGKNIRRGEKLVVNTVDFILRDEKAFRSLIAVTSYDYYTYTHSVNVCVYSIALAQKLGLGDKLDIKTLGTGALLHDVGKSVIDKNIINKKGPLNDEEWQAIKKHPVYGVELLRKTGKIPEESYVVVNQHHERSDRTGYPEGRAMEKIHPYARVSAIADVFDALTTKRAYKGAVGTFAALNIMKDEMSTAFDRDMFREFVQMMGK